MGQRGQRIGLAQVAQEAHDQATADAEVALPRRQRRADAVDHGGHCQATRGMGLRIEEYFGMHHAIGAGTLKIREGEIEEILLLAQHRGAGVIDVEKRLQVVKPIGAAHRFDRRIGQADAAPGGQREQHFRLERALDVQVQLRLRQATDERFECVAIHGQAESPCHGSRRI